MAYINPRLLNELINNSRKCDLTHKHSAVVMKNNQPISFGYNQLRGNNSWHAECDAIRSYLINKGHRRWVTRHFSQCILCNQGSKEYSTMSVKHKSNSNTCQSVESIAHV